MIKSVPKVRHTARLIDLCSCRRMRGVFGLEGCTRKDLRYIPYLGWRALYPIVVRNVEKSPLPCHRWQEAKGHFVQGQWSSQEHIESLSKEREPWKKRWRTLPDSLSSEDLKRIQWRRWPRRSLAKECSPEYFQRACCCSSSSPQQIPS